MLLKILQTQQAYFYLGCQKDGIVSIWADTCIYHRNKTHSNGSNMSSSRENRYPPRNYHCFMCLFYGLLRYIYDVSYYKESIRNQLYVWEIAYVQRFGQDTIDTLFWTATQPQKPRKHYISFIPLMFIALVYAFLHTLLILLQATTLNVAINAANKALLTIMMSNNFVELKSSVFKKFDKKNLFHVSCSDVRERFHLCALLFIVVVQTMKEYGWKEECFWSLAPECLMIMFVEFMVDWIKHAFITKFNEVSTDVYRDYTTSLAYDLAQSKQKSSSSDHSDWISRRMGFIPLPVGVVIIRVISTSVQIDTIQSVILLILAYISLLSCRILVFVLVMGKGCNLINEHKNKLYEEEFKNEEDKVCDILGPNSKVLDVQKPQPQEIIGNDTFLEKEDLVMTIDSHVRVRKRTITSPQPYCDDRLVNLNFGNTSVEGEKVEIMNSPRTLFVKKSIHIDARSNQTKCNGVA
ncbi:TAPT1 [Lepeophtheirus salmonis]|uniref:TAPT1 n=1 Tax=Lepeophtheirus salmonis TaxID=72036 RepID=A0A7R8CS41_LEPSM|nr:TAPT1 [Lepeophtheirus salmonis]CAF2876100.1 TAPT1 [Lepeophtheirus salmonis]